MQALRGKSATAVFHRDHDRNHDRNHRRSKSMTARTVVGFIAAALVSAGAFVALHTGNTRDVHAAGKAAPSTSGWDRQAAERYLDGREVWWQGWDRAQKDHGTYCISCHTQAPYGLARPALRQELGEPAPSGAEQAMLASIEKRVKMWKEVEPFYLDAKYGEGKEIESRNAESVLNAVILSGYDARGGHLSEVTRTAFDNAWALQSQSGPTTGAWVWQNFHYTPWESPESEYHGAALMAMAVGNAPDDYRNDAKIAAHLDALRGYLRDHYEAQPLLNKVIALWASARLSGVMTDEQRGKLIAELKSRERDDGGWSLSDLGTWKRVDDTPLETRSDGYATAVIVLALEENHSKDAAVKRGIAWLEANQDKTTGAWTAWSLNKKRDPQSNAGPFMSDAATAYAVLALDAKR
jgi:squalene-hopene/tetraprenyl-beta-curcumene cyclase